MIAGSIRSLCSLYQVTGFLLSLFCVSSLHAEESAIPPLGETWEEQTTGPSVGERVPMEEVDPTPRYDVWRAGLAIALVLGGLFAARKLLGGTLSGTLRKQKGYRMHIVERVCIDHRRHLLVVSVDDQEWLLAVGPDQITTLAALQQPSPLPKDDASG